MTGASSRRLVVTLAGAGGLAGLLLVLAHEATAARIAEHKAEALRRAIREVLLEPDRYETLYVVDGALTPDVPAGADERSLERVYLGWRDGKPAGYAIASAEPGFQDMLRVLFAYDPETGTVLGLKVLESKETPGLGDRIEKAAFTGQFPGRKAPLRGVRAGAGSGGADEIDMITGATISSRAIVGIVNRALERLGPALRAPRREANR
jgi:electron transport complex protein RnfG